jgi:hypothetical protein
LRDDVVLHWTTEGTIQNNALGAVVEDW